MIDRECHTLGCEGLGRSPLKTTRYKTHEGCTEFTSIINCTFHVTIIRMETITPPIPNAGFRFVLFDFDGTISLIREGWQEIMIPYFIDVLQQTPKAEDAKSIEEIVTTFVDRLTGKQTIFQCIQLDNEVVLRGGAKIDPGIYKAEYLCRLSKHIKNRLDDLHGGCNPQRYLVPGSVHFLKLLKEAGYNLYLASGTDEVDVLAEAKLLGLDRYFGKHIYGARDNETTCSKETVIKHIIAENNLTGRELVSFGDGFVEIELVASIGGYAVGVATDEVQRQGINQRKRRRLLEAGAAMIIADFSDAEGLIAYLFTNECSAK